MSAYKYLGVTITPDLNWNIHICQIVARVNKLEFLHRNFKHGSLNTRLLLYKTFIRPILDYASNVWDPHTTYDVVDLERVQRIAVRFIYNMYASYVSPTDLCSRAGL